MNSKLLKRENGQVSGPRKEAMDSTAQIATARGRTLKICSLKKAFFGRVNGSRDTKDHQIFPWSTTTSASFKVSLLTARGFGTIFSEVKFASLCF